MKGTTLGIIGIDGRIILKWVLNEDGAKL